MLDSYEGSVEELEVPYKRSDDKEAERFISEKVDLETLSQKCERGMLFSSTVLEALARLVYELKDRIPTYGSIIGDDASGRVPTLLLRKLINKKREELGQDSITTFFVDGGRIDDAFRRIRDADTKEFLASNKPKLGERTLISTEYINTGKSVSAIGDILDELGVDFDISTVSVDVGFDRRVTSQRRSFLERVVYGAQNSAGLSIYKHGASGVKRKFREITPFGAVKEFPVPKIKPSTRTPGTLVDQKTIQIARQEIALIAEEFYKLLDD